MVDGETQRKNLLAMAADVEKIAAVMAEVDKLETELIEADPSSPRSIEIKAGIKKAMTSSEMEEALDRLETEGGPVWGLSTEEREMIVAARRKVNEC